MSSSDDDEEDSVAQSIELVVMPTTFSMRFEDQSRSASGCDWDEVKHFLHQLVSSVQPAAVDWETDAGESGMPADELQLLEKCLADFAVLERQLDVHRDSLNLVRQQHASRERAFDSVSVADEFTQRRDAKIATINAAQVGANSERVKQLKRAVMEVHHADALLSDEDEGLLIVESQANGDAPECCPITRLPMQNPLKNKTCGHAYSRDGIEQLFRTSRSSQIDCPIAGCGSAVTNAHLERDADLERRLERAARQQQRKKKHRKRSRNDVENV
jgi:Zinc-finger of the MIZ type in Nse subunit